MRHMRQFILALILLIPTLSYATPVEVSYVVTGHSGDWVLDLSLRNNTTPSGNAPVDFVLYRFGVALPESHILTQPAAWTPTSTPAYNNSWSFDTAPWYSSTPPPGDPPVILFPQTTLSGFLIHSDADEAPLNTPWFAVGSALDGNGYYGFHSGGAYVGSKTRIATFLGSASGVVTETSTPQPQAVPEASSILLLACGIVGLLTLQRLRLGL